MTSEGGESPTLRERAIRQCCDAQEELGVCIMAYARSPRERQDLFPGEWERAGRIFEGTLEIIFEDQTLDIRTRTLMATDLLYEAGAHRAAFLNGAFPGSGMYQLHPSQAKHNKMVEDMLKNTEWDAESIRDWLEGAFNAGVRIQVEHLVNFELNKTLSQEALPQEASLTPESEERKKSLAAFMKRCLDAVRGDKNP